VRSVDGDGDGCTDVEELRDNPVFGGARDRSNFYDFFDVAPAGAKDKSITLADTLLILMHFGHGPGDDALDNELDRRTPDVVNFPWRSAEDNEGIDLSDALANMRQFGHSCDAAPN
jgi:hypothetical protein